MDGEGKRKKEGDDSGLHTSVTRIEMNEGGGIVLSIPKYGDVVYAYSWAKASLDVYLGIFQKEEEL